MAAWPKSSTVGKGGQPAVQCLKPTGGCWGIFLPLMLLLLTTFHLLDLESIRTPHLAELLECN
jgi:hypothetical protein